MTEPSFTPMVCYNHPDRETMLRCNRCNRPICTSCAVLTPTGYRCRECVRGQQRVFETAHQYDFVLAFIIAAALAFAGSYTARVMQFFTIFIAPIAGMIIAEVIRWVVKRRRSRRLFQFAAAGAALGSLPFLVIGLISALGFLSAGLGGGNIWSLVWQGVYSFLVATTVYTRLSGLQL